MYWTSFASRSLGSAMGVSSFPLFGRKAPTRSSAHDAMRPTRRFAFRRESVSESLGDQLRAGGITGRGEVDAVIDEPGVFDVRGPVVDAHVGIAKARFFEFFVPFLHAFLGVEFGRVGERLDVDPERRFAAHDVH